jgi:membrane protease YdiL (CAAX protease family)
VALAAFSLAGRPGALDDPADVPYTLVAAAGYLAMGLVVLKRLPQLVGAAPAGVGARPLNATDAATVAGGTLIVCAMRLLTFGYLAAIGQSNHVQAGLGGFRPTGPLAVALLIIVGAAIAPFSEELLFRGVIYRAMLVRMPDARAAIGSGLVFAAARFDLVLAPFFVAYGTLLAVLYRRTANLFVPIAVRILFDGASYALLVWLTWPAARP